MKTQTPVVDQQILKAIGHPLRQRLLRALNERVASPSELAAEIDEPLPNVSYHFKILLECGVIELVKTAPVRGAVEHFYRATVRPQLDEHAWAALPKSVRQTLTGQTLDQIGTHIADAVKCDGFDAAKTQISWTTLELDDEAYAELAKHLDATLERAMDLHAETLSRRGEDSAGEHQTEMVLLHFHRCPGAARS